MPIEQTKIFYPGDPSRMVQAVGVFASPESPLRVGMTWKRNSQGFMAVIQVRLCHRGAEHIARRVEGPYPFPDGLDDLINAMMLRYKFIARHIVRE